MHFRNIARAIRRIYWRIRLRLPHVHHTFLAGGKSAISSDLIAGPYSYIGPNCEIGPGVSIGAYSMLGPGVRILGNDHIFNLPGCPIIFSGRPDFKKTLIGKDVWIGAQAIIIAGASIGDGAIIAAGAVVTRDIPDFSIVGGVPARIIRKRFSSEDERIHRAYLDRPPQSGKYAARTIKQAGVH